MAMHVHILPLIQIIPAKYLCYFRSLEHQHTLIHQLPRRLRNMIRTDRRDVSLVNQLLDRMMRMNIVKVDGNLQTNRRREQVRALL